MSKDYDSADFEEAPAVPEPEVSSAPAEPIPGPPVGYVDILDYQTEIKINKPADAGDKRRYPLRPSSAGKCEKELAYELMEHFGKATYEKPPKTAELDRIFSAGHNLEYMLIRAFAECKEFFEIRYKQQVLDFFKVECPTDEQLTRLIEGSNDACFWSDKWRSVIDFKTKKDKFSSWRKSSWDETTDKLMKMKTVQMIGDSAKSFWVADLSAFLIELDDPFFESNFLQLNLYANSDFMKSRGVDHGAIIQLNKNDKRLREIRFKPDVRLVEKVKAKFNSALAAAAAGDTELAKRDYALGSVKCAFCDFNKYCWPNPDGDKSADPLKLFFKTLPKQGGWPRDTDRLGDGGGNLERLYSNFKIATEAEEAGSKAEKALVQAFLDAGERKIRFSDGEVYELKHLKSPHPHIELRKSKA